MSGLTYADAGVDTQRGQEQVGLIKDMCKATFDSNVLTSIGGFGAMYELDLSDISNPVLVTGTDGVGTKLMVSQMMDDHSTVGQDLVAMCVNDIICQGAKPLFFLDYIASGYLEPSKMAGLVKGIADGCLLAGASLIGGETAEMPGLYSEEEYDLAGFVVGIVDKDKIISGQNIEDGDIVIALESSGVHSNGMSLARKIVFDHMDYKVDTYIEELDRTIGEELLEPTRIYVKDVLSLIEKIDIKAIANITGGGIYENIPRTVGDKFDVELDLSEVKTPKIFQLLEEWGGVDKKEMYSTFNMGLGMILVVAPEDLHTVKEHFTDYKAWTIGQVVNGSGELKVEF